MLVITYDIKNDKLRTKFSKYLSKFGYRLQYSVFQIENSNRLLNNIRIKIENSFAKEFQESDSVIIFHLSGTCKKYYFGYAVHEKEELIFVN